MRGQIEIQHFAFTGDPAGAGACLLYTSRQHTNLQLHESLQLIVLEQGQSEKMKLSGGRIFVITAGMMSENTAAHNLAARMVGDERQSIFFVGYADPNTPGGRLKAAKQGETFVFSPSAGRVTRKCCLLYTSPFFGGHVLWTSLNTVNVIIIVLSFVLFFPASLVVPVRSRARTEN